MQDFISLHAVSNKTAYDAKSYDVHTYWILRHLFLIIRVCIFIMGGRLVFIGIVWMHLGVNLCAPALCGLSAQCEQIRLHKH